MSIHDGTTNGPTGSSDPGPFPNLRQRRRRGLRLTTAAAVALGLAVGGGAVANASGSGSSTSTTTPGAPSWHGFGGTPPAAFGTVATVGANTFTLTTHDGTKVTVDVNSSTTYMEFGVTAPTVADVKVGTQVVVFGTDTSNTVAATKVGIGGPHGTDGGAGGSGDGDGHGPMGGMPAPGTGQASTNSTNSGSGSSVMA